MTMRAPASEPHAPVLLTPGPTPVPAEVQAAMARPLVHHRSPEFKAIYASVLQRLAAVYRTSGDVVIFTGSGTAAFESACANLIAPGDRVLCVSAGVFGERWIAMAEAYGADVTPLRFALGTRPDPEIVAAAILADPALVAAVVVHSETSTGATADIRAIADLARERGRCLLVVDAVSSLGAAPLETDAWGLDVVISGSQKALMTPPGIAFASISARALERSRSVRTPRFTLDWGRTLAAQAKGQSPFTPAITLVQGLSAGLDLLLAEGLEAAWARTVRLGGMVRARVHELGLELFSPDEPDCSLVTAIRVPDGVDGDAIRIRIRDRDGYVIAGGQGELTGRIWRLGQFGAIGEGDLRGGLDALARELGR